MKIELTIGDAIYERVRRSAEYQGIEPPELLRSMVGRYISHEPTMPESFRMPGDFLEDLMTFMAMAGQLSCPECTQRMTVEMVKAKQCGSCQAPFEMPVS